MRYLLPLPNLVPAKWRRKALAMGSGEPTRAICSTLIAQAFQSISYPVLPRKMKAWKHEPNGERHIEEILQIRHHSLYTPRDFDISPYFEVVKPTLSQGFDYTRSCAGPISPTARPSASCPCAGDAAVHGVKFRGRVGKIARVAPSPPETMSAETVAQSPISSATSSTPTSRRARTPRAHGAANPDRRGHTRPRRPIRRKSARAFPPSPTAICITATPSRSA